MGPDGEFSGSPPSFAIDVAPDGEGGVRLKVHGELDLSTSPELGEIMQREILGGRAVIVDLSGVTFIDSTGLNEMIQALRACEVNGGGLSVAPDLPDQVRRVFEITGLDRVLPIAGE